MEQTITTGGSDGKSNLCAKSNANRSVIQTDKIMHTDKIMQVLSSASMGIWRIIIPEGKEPRLYADTNMLRLLGVAPDSDMTPEDMYKAWGVRVCRDELPRTPRISTTCHSLQEIFHIRDASPLQSWFTQTSFATRKTGKGCWHLSILPLLTSVCATATLSLCSIVVCRTSMPS